MFGDNTFIKQKKSRIAPPEMSGQCGFSFSISFLRSGLPVIHTKTWWGSLIPRSDKSNGWNVHWNQQAGWRRMWTIVYKHRKKVIKKVTEMVINVTLFVTFFSFHYPYSYFFNSSYFFSKMILKSSKQKYGLYLL